MPWGRAFEPRPDQRGAWTSRRTGHPVGGMDGHEPDRARTHARAGVRLAAGRHVVVDDTGSPRSIGDEWRATASVAGVLFVLVWVQIRPELQRERVLANRARQVRPDATDAVLEEHGTSFEPPVEEAPLVIDATFWTMFVDTRASAASDYACAESPPSRVQMPAGIRERARNISRSVRMQRSPAPTFTVACSM